MSQTRIRYTNTDGVLTTKTTVGTNVGEVNVVLNLGAKSGVITNGNAVVAEFNSNGIVQLKLKARKRLMELGANLVTESRIREKTKTTTV